MNWTTLYISGRGDFRDDVRKKLESTDLDIMPGYIEGSSGRTTYDLYWVNESIAIREFKEAIGSKLVWKYRLRFFLHLEEFIQAQAKTPSSLDLTVEEQELVDSFRNGR
jgi:hypothetical protein